MWRARFCRPFGPAMLLCMIQGPRARFASHLPLATFWPRLRRSDSRFYLILAGSNSRFYPPYVLATFCANTTAARKRAIDPRCVEPAALKFARCVGGGVLLTLSCAYV